MLRVALRLRERRGGAPAPAHSPGPADAQEATRWLEGHLNAIRGKWSARLPLQRGGNASAPAPRARSPPTHGGGPNGNRPALTGHLTFPLADRAVATTCNISAGRSQSGFSHSQPRSSTHSN